MDETYDNDKTDIIKAQNGDKEALERLITDNKGLLWSIVRRFKDRGHDLEDLYQLGVLGFIKCIKKFDTNFEVRLSTYAVPYILGEVKRHIRDDGPIKVSRSLKVLCSKIMQIQSEEIRKNGKDMKIDELAKILNTSKEEIALALDSYTPVESIYNNASESLDDELNIIDRLSTGEDEANSIVDKICIKQLLEGLKDKEKELILLRYYKGNTQAQVARIMGTSQVQVSRMEKRILENLKLKLAI